jgi:hypothetical protein
MDRLYRAAWALCGSREEAEDLVQETYARVLAKPRWLRSEDDLGYLLRALRNTFLVRKRTEGRRPRTEPFSEGFEPAGGSSPEAELETREARRSPRSPDFRDVLVAVDVAGLSTTRPRRCASRWIREPSPPRGSRWLALADAGEVRLERDRSLLFQDASEQDVAFNWLEMTHVRPPRRQVTTVRPSRANMQLRAPRSTTVLRMAARPTDDRI